MALVEMTALLGKFQRLAGGDILEVDDGVGNAALGTDDQALEADGFLAVRIADLRIFSNGKFEFVRHGARPFYGPGDGATVGDGNNFIVLRDGECAGGEKQKQRRTASEYVPHFKPLIAHRPLCARLAKVAGQRGTRFGISFSIAQRLIPLRVALYRGPPGPAALVFAVLLNSDGSRYKARVIGIAGVRVLLSRARVEITEVVYRVADALIGMKGLAVVS